MSLNLSRKTIGVFIPFLSGYYFSEVIKEVRKNAVERDLDIILIMTGSFNQYHSSLCLDHIDAAFVVLNAVAPSFIDQLKARDIPVVTTNEEYFAKSVEIILTDQASGIMQAFDHLYELGHRKIGFVGDFSIPDFRSRFGALIDCYNERGLVFNPDWLFTVTEPSMPGGTQAGAEYVLREEKCSALICAADLIAIGVEETVRKAGLSVPEDLAILGVDNTSIGRDHTPPISSIDQGLTTVVARVLDRLQVRLDGAPEELEIKTIPQILKPRRSSGTPPELEDKEESQEQAKYMEDNFEGAMAHAGLGYEWIKNLSRLWGPFFKWSIMGLWQNDEAIKPEEKKIQLIDVFLEAIESNDLSQNYGQQRPGSNFPPNDLIGVEIPDPAFVTVLPVCPEGIDWGVLAIVDELNEDISHARYSMFNYYLVLMYYFMQREALTESIKEREKSARELAKHMEVVANTSNDGIWSWDLETNTMDWNNRLLEMLGFTDQEDKDTYRNMTLLERVHPQDHDHVKNSLKNHFQHFHIFKTNFRIRAKSGRYLWVEANGEAIRESNGHISRFVGALTDITEQRRTEKRIEHMAYHDGLTGLLNRTSITEKIVNHIRDIKTPFAVMVMDLNRFKMVNDSFGHRVGDALLNHVASKSKLALREGDLLSRFGGDEFVFMCHINTERDATILSDRILKNVKGAFHHENYELAVDVSLGISLYPDDGEFFDELIKKADLAMYKAKVNKLDHATLYTKDMDVDIKKRIEMESHLRKATQFGEMFLLLQPQVDSQTGEVKGCEALARWHSPVFGLVSPAIFIPLAEEIGLIGELGEWVIDTALSIIREWENKGYTNPKISVNVSAGQLHQADFASNLRQKIEDAGVNPHTLNLEITESTAITHIEHTRDQLQRLADFGVAISLDDFGTGHSSLSLLNDLPLHWVKIDRSFISKVSDSDINTGMTKSITEMCHSLGYKLVAEGVEEPEQLEIIQRIGCDLIQGFYFSKPVKPGEFEAHFLGKTLPLKP